MDAQPEINREFVVKKATLFFPNEDIETIASLLDQYGVETYEREQARVQLAILKLSEGSSDTLIHYIQVAKTDYRDVLAWAEYPEQMSVGFSRKLSQTDMEEIKKRDRQQYLNWLFAQPGVKERIKLTQAQKSELDRRIAAHKANPEEAYSWEEVQLYSNASLRNKREPREAIEGIRHELEAGDAGRVRLADGAFAGMRRSQLLATWAIAEKHLRQALVDIETLAQRNRGVEEALDDIRDFISQNEFGLALEHLCSMIDGCGFTVSPRTYAAIDAAGKVMRMDPSTWQRIKPSN